MPLVVGLDLSETLRLAAKGLAAVQIGVIVHLKEGLKTDAEPLGVMHNAVMMIGNPPRPWIDVQVLVEFALLGESAKFRIAVAAAKAPVAPARPAVVLENLNLVAGVAQLIR